MEQRDKLLRVVNEIKAILIARATGGDFDNDEYQRYRTNLISSSLLIKLIPPFLKYYETLGDFWDYISSQFVTYKDRRAHIHESFKPLLKYIYESSQSPVHANTDTVLKKLNSRSVRHTWNKAITRLNDDHEGAITVAITLLEDTIKKILIDLGVEYGPKDGLHEVYKKLSPNLNLSTSQHTEKLYVQALSGCKTAIQAIGSIRNKGSDPLASGNDFPKPALRHAELVVNLAGSMATFLIATWENNK